MHQYTVLSSRNVKCALIIRFHLKSETALTLHETNPAINTDCSQTDHRFIQGPVVFLVLFNPAVQVLPLYKVTPIWTMELSAFMFCCFRLDFECYIRFLMCRHIFISLFLHNLVIFSYLQKHPRIIFCRDFILDTLM